MYKSLVVVRFTKILLKGQWENWGILGLKMVRDDSAVVVPVMH